MKAKVYSSLNSKTYIFLKLIRPHHYYYTKYGGLALNQRQVIAWTTSHNVCLMRSDLNDSIIVKVDKKTALSLHFKRILVTKRFSAVSQIRHRDKNIFISILWWQLVTKSYWKIRWSKFFCSNPISFQTQCHSSASNKINQMPNLLLNSMNASRDYRLTF